MLIQFSIDRMVCSHLLAIVNSAAMNMGIQIHLQDPTFNSLGYIYSEVGLLNQVVVSFLIVSRTPMFKAESEVGP